MVNTLDAAQLARFAREGYLVVPGAVTPARCDALCAHISRVVATAAARPDERAFWPLLRRSAHGLEVMWDTAAGPPAERTVMRLGHGLHLVDDEFAAACREPAIAGGLRAVVGADARLVQSAVVYKQPQSDAVQFGWHQDSWYLAATPDSLVLAFLALDDMDEANGCLEVLPGSHRGARDVLLALGPEGFRSVSGRSPGPVDERGAVKLPVARGTVIFAHGRTYHASAPNRSDRPRRALIVHALGGDATVDPVSWIQPPPGGFAPL